MTGFYPAETKGNESRRRYIREMRAKNLYTLGPSHPNGILPDLIRKKDSDDNSEIQIHLRHYHPRRVIMDVSSTTDNLIVYF